MSEAGVHRPRDTWVGVTVNAIEWYDFAVFGALASVLAVALFPPGDDSERLTLVFAVFATSFLARPLGAVLVGMRADRRGRRQPFVAMVVLMSVATALIGLVPSWSNVGRLAPLLLVLLRLIQGFASGGGISTSIPFVLEAATPGRWGRQSGWHTATVAGGIASGIAVAGLLSSFLPGAALEAWGWRIAFLAALPLGLVGIAARSPGRDAPLHDASSNSPGPDGVRQVWRSNRQVLSTGFALVSVLAATFNLWFLFLPAELHTRDVYSLPTSLAAAGGGLLVAAIAAPWFGARSDRTGRSRMLARATFGWGCLTVPLYLLVTSGSVTALVLADALVGCLLGAMVIGAYVVERLHPDVRATGVALSYGMATALVGGTAPLVGGLLAERGLSILMPVYLSVLCAVACRSVLRASRDYPQRVTSELGV